MISPEPVFSKAWLGSIVGFARCTVVFVEAVRKLRVRWRRPAHDARDDGATVAMDTARVDQILQYALAVASEADEPFDRRLGKIHLIKYVYLADLAHAEKYGVTFTGAPWRFYHYGPWDLGVCNRIEPVLKDIGAIEHVWASTNYDTDTVRWSIDSEEAKELIRDLDKALPVHITLELRRDVRKFGNDTSSLLHGVYTTVPMLHAAPNQFFDFAIAQKPSKQPEAPTSAPTVKEIKRRREAVLKISDRLHAAVSSPGASKRKPPELKPIYDDIFFGGARQIDALAGSSPSGISGDAELADSICASEVRKRGRLP